ncbi:MAG: hypothetical protein JXB39_16075 [Deltaproteobacteria bacterium]|nr:hypothetical protein [Deltaproteobacteria bacterium]
MIAILALLSACGADPAPPVATEGGPGLVLEGVRADLPATAPAPSLHVTARRAAWDLPGRTVRFEGDVRGIRGDVTLDCAVLEVWFTDPDALERAEASGDVRVRQGAREARARAAVLDVPRGRIELSGSPSLAEEGLRLTGERIVLLLDDERIECDACSLEFLEAAPEPGR